MKTLSFQIEDHVVAEILGVQNFTSDESAILEIVKNAYDAGASHLELHFVNNILEIIDDGIGMSLDDIYQLWMYVGKSNKGYTFSDKDKQLRVSAGSKGIGRFALARLGAHVELYSKKHDFNGVKWETDWTNSNVEELSFEIPEGTRIIVSNLRVFWGKRKLNQLKGFIARTYNDTKMNIRIVGDEFDEVVVPIYPEPKVGNNCKSYIDLQYKSGKLIVDVTNDEFIDEVQEICKEADINIYGYHYEQEVIELLTNWDNKESDGNERYSIDRLLTDLGDFRANFFFNFKASKKDREKYKYKYTETVSPISKGVILYRNAFSLSSYDGNKDWLNLNARARKSPAAATHPTGAWRIRENQVAGFVFIDKEQNPHLKDLSNRQGLDENIYFYLLLEIISLGLKEFERYRQSIMRQIRVYNESQIKVETNEFPDFIKDLLSEKYKIQHLTEKQGAMVLAEIVRLQSSVSQLTKVEKQVNEQYRYDVRLLNTLSTIGMKVASSAHELNNSRNQFILSYDNIENALKEYDMWNTLSLPEYTKFSYKNVPRLIDEGKSFISKILYVVDTILQTNEVNRFIPQITDISVLMQTILNRWKSEYARIQFRLDIEQSLLLTLSNDVLWTIFDNLILNSVQQNLGSIIISIKVWKDLDKVYFIYQDNGKGLPTKYQSRPMIILEPHESSRVGGHGLGMWIVNNTIKLLGGDIKSIQGIEGFLIEFYIREM